MWETSSVQFSGSIHFIVLPAIGAQFLPCPSEP